jgi:uncharacterized surface protein with fasciclin (FAS1) repeats
MKLRTTSRLAALAAAISLASVPLAAGSSCGSGSWGGGSEHSSRAEAKPEKKEAKDIVDTAVAAGSFETLVAAVKAAGLVDTLKGEGPFTVFAPTDEAFKKLPEGTVADLLKPENKEKLTAILTYHVVPGKVLAKDVVGVKSAKTVNGKELTVKVDGDTVMIDSAKVVKTDIHTSNGVIHVIDTVLLPKE